MGIGVDQLALRQQRALGDELFAHRLVGLEHMEADEQRHHRRVDAVGAVNVEALRRNGRGNLEPHAGAALGLVAVIGLALVNAQAMIWKVMAVPAAQGSYSVLFYAVTGLVTLLAIVGVVFSAVTALLTPGMGITRCPARLTWATNTAPGSDTAGVPASLR